MADTDAQSSTDARSPPPEPLFTLDLAENGGVLAPHSFEALVSWIQREVSFWQWLGSARGGQHIDRLRQSLPPLNEALHAAQTAWQRQKANNDPNIVRQQTDIARDRLSRVLVSQRWPHSSTARAMRAKDISDLSPNAAAAYLWALTPDNANIRFEPNDIPSWHGFIEGLVERFGRFDGKGGAQAQTKALTTLHGRMEAMLHEKQMAYEELQRDYASAVETMNERLTTQKEDFSTIEAEAKAAHEAALEDHLGQMRAVQAAFREEMKLRGPVEYWSERKKHHEEQTKTYMKRALGSMAGLAAALAVAAHQVWRFSEQADKPAGWMLAVLGVMAVLGVWAVRLLVRIYLSHQHLATDAAERVTMVQTYLALLADDKMPKDEDRKLVLQPLFRPAADGIVKDEGLPHPALDFFTRPGRPG